MTGRDLLATLATMEDDDLDKRVEAFSSHLIGFPVRSVETDEDSIMLMERA